MLCQPEPHCFDIHKKKMYLSFISQNEHARHDTRLGSHANKWIPYCNLIFIRIQNNHTFVFMQSHSGGWCYFPRRNVSHNSSVSIVIFLQAIEKFANSEQ